MKKLFLSFLVLISLMMFSISEIETSRTPKFSTIQIKESL